MTTRKQPEVDGRDEVGQHQYREPGDDGQRREEHGLADASVAAVHGGNVVAVFMELGFEPVDVVDGVVHGDADGDGGDVP